jgi:hypothetical protein
MKFRTIAITLLMPFYANAQQNYTHAKELGFSGSPKTVVTQSFEARIGKDSTYQKAARYPYSKEVTRFMPNGNMANSISYWFDNIHPPYTDTIEMTRTEYMYNGNKCSGLIIYSNDVKYLKSKRTWQNERQYTDSTYIFSSRTDDTGKLTAITEVTLNEDYTPQKTKRTDLYKVMRNYGEGSSSSVSLRENQPPIVSEYTPKDDAVFTTKDEKGNKLTAYFETGYSSYKEYMMEEYSYEYY